MSNQYRHYREFVQNARDEKACRAYWSRINMMSLDNATAIAASMTTEEYQSWWASTPDSDWGFLDATEKKLEEVFDIHLRSADWSSYIQHTPK